MPEEEDLKGNERIKTLLYIDKNTEAQLILAKIKETELNFKNYYKIAIDYLAKKGEI